MKSVDNKRPLKVFLCHASADKPAVRDLYKRLTADGVDAWLDAENLIAGQNWQVEIPKAIRESDVVIICLSKKFNQRGFRQKEVRLALDTAMEQPEGEIFIIPARLEECENLETLTNWHWVNLFEEDGYKKLIQSLQKRSTSIEVSFSKDIPRKSSELIRETTNQSTLNKMDFESEVSDSIIVMGSGNVINMNTKATHAQQEKESYKQADLHSVIKEIKSHIEFGLYIEAYKKCESLISKGEDNALINLFAGIAYALNKEEKKMRNNDMQVINKYISLAVRDDNLRHTALAVLGCIKYGYCYLNKLHDSSHLTLELIKEELQKSSDKIDRELLSLINPTDYALEFLKIL